MDHTDAKKYYEFWARNCKYCTNDGQCAEQDARKESTAPEGKCAKFKDKG